MDQATVESYITSMPHVHLEHPFGKGVAVYKVDDKMFALIAEGTAPVQLSLKCDPLLASTLRERYESVMPGHQLNKKYWNTLVLTGQLSWEEVQALIRHSYQLVVAE